MKKIILLALVLITGLECFASLRREPCAKINQSRTITEAKSFLLQNGVYFDNLRFAYAESYNRVTGKNVPATKDGMETIFEHTTFVHKSFVNPDEYENGVKIGDEVQFTNLVGAESDYWLAATDDDGKALGIFAKASCLNPQRKKKTSKSGEKYIETIRLDTLIVRTIKNKIYRDSIINVEYVNIVERPIQTVTVYSYIENGNSWYNYGYTNYVYWGMSNFLPMYNSYCYNPPPCYSCNEQPRYHQKPYHRRERTSDWGTRYTPPPNTGGGRYTPPGNGEGGGRYTPPANENTGGNATRYTPSENGGGKKSAVYQTARNTASNVVARSDRPETQRSYSQPQQDQPARQNYGQPASRQTERQSDQRNHHQSAQQNTPRTSSSQQTPPQARQQSSPSVQRSGNPSGNTGGGYAPARSNSNSAPTGRLNSGGATRSSGGVRR